MKKVESNVLGKKKHIQMRSLKSLQVSKSRLVKSKLCLK